MKVDDTVLMTYVDDALSPNDRQQVEQAICEHAQWAEQVALLEASRLPYPDAFAHQKLPPVPASLTKNIEDMVRAHAARSTATRLPADGPAATGANDPLIGQDVQGTQSAPVRSRLRMAPPWLAVAFVAGVFCGGVVWHFAPGPDTGRTSLASMEMGDAPWVRVAAGYQQLYSRDTVMSATPDAVAAKTVDAIHRVDGISVRIPDLSKAGLKFESVQRLRFHDRPLVQIVYLPEKGQPVALCVTKEKKPDQALTSSRIDNMNVVTWRQAELGYALIGASSDGELVGLGRQISNYRFDPLFGST